MDNRRIHGKAAIDEAVDSVKDGEVRVIIRNRAIKKVLQQECKYDDSLDK